jgi:hypothetical protein
VGALGLSLTIPKPSPDPCALRIQKRHPGGVPTPELTPEQKAAFDRVKAQSRIDPVVVGVLMRAAELSDGSLVRQILERHVTDMDALIADLPRDVRENPGKQ